MATTVDSSTAAASEGPPPVIPPDVTYLQWLGIAVMLTIVAFVLFFVLLWGGLTDWKYDTRGYKPDRETGQHVKGEDIIVDSGLFQPRITRVPYANLESFKSGTGLGAVFGATGIQRIPGAAFPPNNPPTSNAPQANLVTLLPDDDSHFFALAQQTRFPFPQTSNIPTEFLYLTDVPPVMFVNSTGLALAYLAQVGGSLTGQLFVAQTVSNTTSYTAWNSAIQVALIPDLAGADPDFVTLNAVGRLNIRMAICVTYKNSSDELVQCTVMADQNNATWDPPVYVTLDWRATPDPGDTLIRVDQADNMLNIAAAPNDTVPNNQPLMLALLVTFENTATTYTTSLISQYTLDAANAGGTLIDHQVTYLTDASTESNQKCPQFALSSNTAYVGYNNGTDFELQKYAVSLGTSWTAGFTAVTPITVDQSGFTLVVNDGATPNEVWIIDALESSAYFDPIGLYIGTINATTRSVASVSSKLSLPGVDGINDGVKQISVGNSGGLIHLCTGSLGDTVDAGGITYLTTDTDADGSLLTVGVATFANNVDPNFQFVFPESTSVPTADLVPIFTIYSPGGGANDGMATFMQSAYRTTFTYDAYARWDNPVVYNTFTSTPSTGAPPPADSSTLMLSPVTASGMTQVSAASRAPGGRAVSRTQSTARAMHAQREHGWHIRQMRRTMHNPEARARYKDVFAKKYDTCGLCLRETDAARTLRDVSKPVQVNGSETGAVRGRVLPGPRRKSEPRRPTHPEISNVLRRRQPGHRGTASRPAVRRRHGEEEEKHSEPANRGTGLLPRSRFR